MTLSCFGFGIIVIGFHLWAILVITVITVLEFAKSFKDGKWNKLWTTIFWLVVVPGAIANVISAGTWLGLITVAGNSMQCQ